MSAPPEFAVSATVVSREPHPLVDALCDAALGSHLRLLDTTLRNLDMALVQHAAGSVPRVQLELSERLRYERTALQRRYLREVARRFSPQVIPAGGSADRELQRYTRPPTEVLEEQLALDALARRLRAAHESRLTLLEQRLRVLVRRSSAPISTTVYAPATAIEALRVTLEALDFDLPLRQVLYALYEPAAVATLGEIYEQAVGVLNRRGEDSFTVDAGEAAVADSRLTADEATLATLRERLSASRNPAETRLASTLLGIVRDTPAELHEQQPVIQRLALLGRLCTAQFESLASQVRAKVETLRFTLVKIVLVDSGFFASPGHPIRLLLREACERQDAEKREQVCERIEQVAMNAHFVLDALPRLAPLGTPLIDNCLDQLRQQDHSREESKLNEARRTVAQALTQATILHSRPQGLRLFLRAGWGPLLTQRLLRHGQPSAPWQAALDQLAQLLAALTSTTTRVRDFESLLNSLSAEMFDAGMRSDRCERLVQALREAFYELRMGEDSSLPTARNTPSKSRRFGVGELELPDFTAPVAAAEAPAPAARSAPADIEPDLELQPAPRKRPPA